MHSLFDQHKQVISFGTPEEKQFYFEEQSNYVYHTDAAAAALDEVFGIRARVHQNLTNLQQYSPKEVAFALSYDGRKTIRRYARGKTLGTKGYELVNKFGITQAFAQKIVEELDARPSN